MRTYIPVLSIAGSDSSGGAGIQADIKTISALGCYAMTAITAITAQNTMGVLDIQGIDTSIVRAQIDAVFTDVPPLAVKTGMLYNAEIVECVAEKMQQYSVNALVIDPVMVSTSGSMLLSDDAVNIMTGKLFPLATLVTPNRMESLRLTGTEDVNEQARVLSEMGCRNILLKGGDSDDNNVKVDYLKLSTEPELIALRADAVDTNNTHGTGCTLSSAIASYLAMGLDIEDACIRAKLYITRALAAGARIMSGHGHGPVNHLFGPRHMKYLNIDSNGNYIKQQKNYRR